MNAPLRATGLKRTGEPGPVPFDLVILPHDLRRLRRRLLTCVHGDEVLVDFADTTSMAHGDMLELADGRRVEVIAAEEELLEIRGRDARHLLALAWHIGNRHLAAEIGGDHILILHDHVIGHMLEHLGARVTRMSRPFHPEGGAYGGHDHHHD